ncbi:MAG: hypothetical protein KDJ77_10335, partial [Rhodobiaceae bacterium]|nr:hypothetical protein [Rhodobiaceae bacterium]
LADGMPEEVPEVIAAPSTWIIVQSSNALSPISQTAQGHYASSSGDVDPGVVTIIPENFFMPDVGVTVEQSRMRPPHRNRAVVVGR